MVSLSVRENWQACSLLLQRGNYFTSTYSILAMSGQLLTFVLLWDCQEAFGGFWIVLCPLWWLLRAGCSWSWWLWQLPTPLGVVPFCLGAALASWGSRNGLGKDFVVQPPAESRSSSALLWASLWWSNFHLGVFQIGAGHGKGVSQLAPALLHVELALQGHCRDTAGTPPCSLGWRGRSQMCPQGCPSRACLASPPTYRKSRQESFPGSKTTAKGEGEEPEELGAGAAHRDQLLGVRHRAGTETKLHNPLLQELCAISTLWWREGGPAVMGGRREPDRFPSPALSASAARFPLSDLVFLSPQPLCASSRLCRGVLSTVGDKDTSELAQKRGRATWVPGWQWQQDAVASRAAHTNTESPRAAAWEETVRAGAVLQLLGQAGWLWGMAGPWACWGLQLLSRCHRITWGYPELQGTHQDRHSPAPDPALGPQVKTNLLRQIKPKIWDVPRASLDNPSPCNLPPCERRWTRCDGWQGGHLRAFPTPALSASALSRCSHPPISPSCPHKGPTNDGQRGLNPFHDLLKALNEIP
ncbi:uncharacterized protein LOC132334103 [Haemorhous mexicanus]|uniref:uncharacterized protein LOC132334103 n=1 Tax=Haemorhous mexicanus TaxID=30427 RepID=UPI0028BEEA77|nr:uncharacterized protein LOC132334103 [Haemorhous mexicanus]